MSVMTEATSTSLVTQVAAMPRVNLLPPEIAEAARKRQLRLFVVGAGVAAAVGVGLLYTGAAAQANQAADDLAAAQAVTATLQARVAEFSEVPKVYAQVAAAETQLTQAMSQEVRFSFLLNDLSLTIPNRVWLDNLAIEQPFAPVEAGAPVPGTVPLDPATAPVTGTFGAPGIATITFEGFALEHNDVATWLDSLTKQPAYADPEFSTSVAEEIEGTGVTAVRSTSSVTVTDQAYSGRYTEQGGN